MPQPDEQTVPARKSRHAADEDQAEVQLDGTWNTAEYEAVLREEAARHRRPETLADSTRLRPVSVPPSTRRSAETLFELGDYEDSFIEQGFPEMTRAEERAELRRADAIRLAEERRTENAKQEAASRTAGILSRFLPRKSDARKAEPRSTRSRGGKSRGSDAAKDKPDPAPAAQIPHQRGKHAAAPAPLITVSALPAVRDALAEGLPAAARAAGSIREWALYTGEQPPATGSHRAPGTLPIESWLLVGKTRQQALLGTLVAVGLLLIFIPMQQHGAGADPVNAAERAAAKLDGRSSQQRAAIPPAVRDSPSAAPAKTTAKPTASASGSSAKPAIPQGGGPGDSLLSTGTKAVALTFDDGPDPVQTPKILALLAQYDVKATFCLVGQNVERHPEIVQQIVAAGHTLCDHTWNHSLTIGKDKPAQIQADLKRTNDAIEAAVPGVPIPFFRAPGGNFTDRLVKVAAGDGMTSLYWRVDPRDWDHPAGEDDAAHITKVVDTVHKTVKPGSIILSHDFNQPDTIKAYEQLLPWLKDNFQLGLPPEKVSPQPSSSAPSSPAPSSPAVPPTAEPSESPSEPAPTASGS
jgi:peptidoglycan/xylan/chitin deacetylase (PgdA/CDA1 family)